VLAPRDGIVDAMTAQPGDFAGGRATAARIGDPGGLQARIGLSERCNPRAAGRAGDRDAAGSRNAQRRRPGSAIEERVDKDSRLAAALVAVPGGKGLMPGTVAGASWCEPAGACVGARGLLV